MDITDGRQKLDNYNYYSIIIIIIYSINNKVHACISRRASREYIIRSY